MGHYPAKETEIKWQAIWKEQDAYRTVDPPANPFYMLVMYPYPSGDLHMGHMKNYIIGDVMARYKSMVGYDVLHPMGWDAFGLPAEEAAIKRQLNPQTWTLSNIATSKATMESMGLSYDWTREVTTCLPDYYRWTQWVFQLLYSRGLAYLGEGWVNWCPECQSVLANEQVHGGYCWRHETQLVEKRKLSNQWFFRITDYAQRLLDNLDKLPQWPESIKQMQRHWIGRSEGTEITFHLSGNREVSFTVFTTRPDTVFGVTFLAIAPEHSEMDNLLDTMPNRQEVIDYIRRAQAKTEIIRTAEGDKDGVATGLYVINPYTREAVPLWVADYVIATYGSGAVMAVPAHDSRDFQFARKYDLPVRVVIQPPDRKLTPVEMVDAYTEPGIMCNSGPFDGTPSVEGKAKVTQYGAEKDFAKLKIQFRLRDWLISRQRYWGSPIPMIYCNYCGMVPVPTASLPVELPQDIRLVTKARSPLADSEEFMAIPCPRCERMARRDADTMDTFMDSSWYFFRYTDPTNEKLPFDKEKAAQWLPVNLYIGGAEHACMHLIYFRFITQVLYDAGYSPVEEPVTHLFNHGMVTDTEGRVMSKSKGNAVPVGPFVAEYGADVGRVTTLFAGPPEKESQWSDKGVKGADRFVNRVTRLLDGWLKVAERREPPKGLNDIPERADRDVYRAIHRCLVRVTRDTQDLQFNTAIAAMMELLNDVGNIPPQSLNWTYIHAGTFIRMLAPYVPHLAQEYWQQLTGSQVPLWKQPWPVVDNEALVEIAVEIPVQINGKLRGTVNLSRNASSVAAVEAAKADPKIAAHLVGVRVQRVIYLPDKMLNIIVG